MANKYAQVDEGTTIIILAKLTCDKSSYKDWKFHV